MFMIYKSIFSHKFSKYLNSEVLITNVAVI